MPHTKTIGNWLLPNNVVHDGGGALVHQRSGVNVIQGRSEKMSKSKRTSSTPNTSSGLTGPTQRGFSCFRIARRIATWIGLTWRRGAWRYLNRLWRLVENLDTDADDEVVKHLRYSGTGRSPSGAQNNRFRLFGPRSVPL